MFDHRDQPDPRDETTLLITPDGDRFRVSELEDAFVRLHSIGPSLTLDARLTTDGSTVSYTVSATAAGDAVERAFRTVCSTGTQFESLTTPPESPLLDDSDQPDAALKLRGRPERRRDWQTRLRPTVEVDDVGVRGLPLATVADAIAAADASVVYQAVLTPKPDWRVAADVRLDRLRADRDTLSQRVIGPLLDGPPTHPDAQEQPQSHAHSRSHQGGYRRSNSPSTPTSDATPASSPNARRVDAIQATDPRHSFVVNVRAVAAGPDAHSVLRAIGTALVPANGPFYELTPVIYDDRDAVEPVAERLQAGTCIRTPSLATRLRQRVPLASNTSPVIVADPLTAPNVCLLDGEALDTTGQRALDVTPDDRTGIPLPPDDTLTTYQNGMPLGRPLTADDTPRDQPVALPPNLQPLHVAWFGRTGSGKSTSLATAMLENHAATDGADILIDRKGDGLPTDYLRAHYHRYGSLENVLYYDCKELLPALSFFDIRDQLAADIPRQTAVEAVADHYIELLQAVMAGKNFQQAVRSPDLIRYLVKALFDPVHGSDAYTHRDLEAAVATMRATGEPPRVSDPDLARMLDGVAATRDRSLNQLLDGVRTRIEKLPSDHRLNQLFNHAPDHPTLDGPSERDSDPDGDSDADPDPTDTPPLLDLRSVLDDDVVILIDTGALRPASQQAFTLVVLSQLWTALQHRTRHQQPDGQCDTAAAQPTDDTTPDPRHPAPDEPPQNPALEEPPADSLAESEPPLVNLYLEEAADVAATGLVSDLLSQSRAFGLSVTLAMQFPGQLKRRDPDTYQELLNNVATIVTGSVPADDALTTRLATSGMPPDEVANRLRSLPRGHWLTTLPAAFGDDHPAPFQLASTQPPAGHPAADTTLDTAQQQAFTAARTLCQNHTRTTAGLDITNTPPDEATSTPNGEVEADHHQDPAPDTEADPDEPTDPTRRPRVDTTLPYTQRLPTHLTYDPDRHALTCHECHAHYAPAPTGLQRALACHPPGDDPDDIDPDTIPICNVDLTLTPQERTATDYTDAQLMFLQAVYNASQGRYDPPHYDLTRDSMVRLREYIDITPDAVEDLQRDGLLRHDGDYPHRLYTVTPDGRTLLGEDHRRGVAHGHHQGDLAESSHHRMLVELGRRYLDHEYRRDPNSPVQEIVTYHELPTDTLAHQVADAHHRDAAGNNLRLDAAGLDHNHEITVVLEAERINNDHHHAIPADYQKLAACQPQDAIWLVPRKPDAHTIINTLHSNGHLDTTYADTTPPTDFTINQPGLTAIHTIGTITTHLHPTD